MDVKLIIVEKGRRIRKWQSKTCQALAAEETKAVQLQFWGDESDAFEPGNIIHLEKGIFSFDRKKNRVLRARRRGKDREAAELTMLFSETPNPSYLNDTLH